MPNDYYTLEDAEGLRNIATDIAMRHLGLSYIWGGDDPIYGYDCSGFCIEILKSVGILPRDGDWTANSLWILLKDEYATTPYRGCLVFWSNKDMSRVIHVEFCIGYGLCIGASGGGSQTKNSKDAAKQNAYIKIRPYKTRKHIWGYVDPFKILQK